jgi:glycine betaine/proline transport system permease protein
MQTIPTFVYLIPALILFGLGMVPGLVATVIFAIPAPIRLTHLGISSTPTAAVEAGEAFGCSRRGSCCGRWSCPMPCRRSWPG